MDTVAVAFNVQIPERVAERNMRHHNYGGYMGPEWKSYSLILPLDNGAVVDLTYTPPNPTYKGISPVGGRQIFPNPRLKVEVSLPNVLYGDNVHIQSTMSEIELFIETLNKFLRRQFWLPTLDIGSGMLGRIDLPYNHQVGPFVPTYIRALFNLTYPQRKTAPYFEDGVNVGVMFKGDGKNSVIVLKFYDKFVRSKGLAAALGILRQEITIRKLYYIERVTRINNPTIRDITPDLEKELLRKDLERLHIYNTSFCGRNQAHDTLRAAYGKSKGDRLFSYLVDRQSGDLLQLASGPAEIQAFQRNERDIMAAGISMALVDSIVPLPGLVIV